MLTIEEIRRARLRQLAEEAGSQAALSRRVNRSPNQVNQWLGKGTARDMDSDTARMFEDVCGKPHGWMDNLPESGERSHAVGLDFETIAGAVEVLRNYLELTGQPPELVSDPVYLAIMYEAVEEFGGDVRPDNVLDITKWAAKRVREDGGSSATDEVQGDRRAAGGTPA